MTNYDPFAKQYSDSQSEIGDFYHKTQIDPYVFDLIGDPKGKVIYDVGCGNGYISRNLAKRGAKVYASDISSTLIKIAKEKSKGLDIIYSVHDAINVDEYKSGMFDIVVMNMVIHYIADIDKLFSNINKVLKRGGIFVFSSGHPFRPGYPWADWEKGKLYKKDVLFIKVTGYLKREVRNTPCWCDKKTNLTFYNQTLGDLVNTMSKHGLYTYHIDEPESEGFAHKFSKKLQKSPHIPTFIIIGAVKK
jgi:ubiquinone/menaquinone biosynthesis C-methylase UbiE